MRECSPADGVQPLAAVTLPHQTHLMKFPGKKPLRVHGLCDDYTISLPAGEWAVTRTAEHGEPDLTWVHLNDCTAPASHLLCPLAWGSCCGWPGRVVFGEWASSSFSCCTSRAKCCSKSLFCSSSWWTRAWASIRAAVSAAIWSFNSCTWSGNKGQSVFVSNWTNLQKPMWSVCVWILRSQHNQPNQTWKTKINMYLFSSSSDL